MKFTISKRSKISKTSETRMNWSFAVVGVLAVAGSIFLSFRTYVFIQESVSTMGQVVELIAKRDSDGTTYAPVFVFKDKRGRTYKVTSNTYSSPPAYDEGEVVPVLYLERNPREAKIDGIFSLWGAGLILGGVGLVFSSVGIAGLLRARKKEEGQLVAKSQGKMVYATLVGIEEVEDSLIRLLCHWTDPVTSKLYVFKGEPLNFKPSLVTVGEDVPVFVDRENPDDYFVDNDRYVSGK